MSPKVCRATSWACAWPTTRPGTCGHVTALIDQRLEDIERRLAELAKTRDELRGLARRAAGTDPATCTEDDDICTILAAPGR